MKNKKAIVKTPVELQLQKFKLATLSQQQNMEVEYHTLRMLNYITIHNPEIVNTQIFTAIFNQILHYQEVEALKLLPLFENIFYRLWTNQNFNIQIRQKTNFYRIVSNWIINFELRSGKLNSVYAQFEIIQNFMIKQTNTLLQRIVMIQQTFQDIKELIGEQFWMQQQLITIQKASIQKLGKRQTIKAQVVQVKDQCSQDIVNTITKILSVLESILNPNFCYVKNIGKLYKNCIYADLNFKNVKQFIKKSIYFILRQSSVPSYLQNELSKIAIMYMKFLTADQSADIVNMLKHLMLRTDKAVRFALVVEYVQFYEYLQKMEFENVIEQLENMIYFRQLIIGKQIVEQNIIDMGNGVNELNLNYYKLYIKAGTCKKIYFSNEISESILKLDIILQQNDIDIKINYYNGLPIEKKNYSSINKYIFDTVNSLNQYDASKLNSQKIYWKQQRSTSKKLQLILQYQGLYSIQFDNYYSWLIPKNVRYKLQIYRPLN